MSASTMTQQYQVGTCPACQSGIYVGAVIELDATGIERPPDPRQEAKVTLSGKITGAHVLNHDCRKKVTR